MIEYDGLFSKYTESSRYSLNTKGLYFWGSSYIVANTLFNVNQNQREFRLLELRGRTDDIERLITFEYGDIYAKSTFWGSAVRIAGIQVSKNFRLKPDIITYPLPDFQGEVMLPSSIDIYYNQAKVLTENLKPGPFEIKDIPIMTGEGNLRVVIKDVLGREKVVEIPFMTDRALLKPGLTEYAISIGAIKKNYFNDFFSYGKFVFNSYYKKGVLNWFSFGTGLYLQGADGFAAGFSPYFLSKLGLIIPKTALSYNKGKFSALYGIDYSKRIGIFNARFSYTKRQDNFLRPSSRLASIKESITSSLSVNMGNFGNITLFYNRRAYEGDREEEQTTNIIYNKSLFKRVSLNVGYSKSLKNQYFYGSLNLPLGGSHSSSFKYQNKDSQNSYTFSVRRNNSFNKGLSYQGSFNKTDGNNNITFSSSYNFEQLTLSGGISSTKNSSYSSTSYRAGVSGSIIFMDGEIFLKRKIYNSFAIIKIDPPMKNVEVKVNNRAAGKTDKRGTLFVPYLNPYRHNEVRINPATLDIKSVIDKNIYSFIPYQKHGYLLKFKTKKVNSIRLKILLPDGSYLPAGSKIEVDGKDSGIVGFKGKSYIENISVGKHKISVDYLDGRCETEINITQDMIEKVVPFIGVYTCNLKNVHMIAKKEGKYIINTKRSKSIKNKENMTKEETKPNNLTLNKQKNKKVSISQKRENIEIVNYDDFQSIEEFLEFRESLKIDVQ
ncbi:fimbrial biogenesis outer membrane usher protein [Persephonella atlantica]|uniref:Fimbrial biogenesis outer membrane usher protein n=1 Tax=Persephonella atlantica TaxID=2699429 RepID=A0ABS1GGQ5_9AQUI|nr:fimbria/pilus outer membrane usher protein [Persephonella atlantica]MBK3332083.1 fimbrial biogenesis outer membrane usher protein [Persephonella atlantica]